MAMTDTSDTDTVEKNEKLTPDDAHSIEYENPPVDKGWAWMIALAVFLLYAIYGGIHVTISVLLLDILDKFDMSITTMTLQMALNQVFYGLSSQVSANILAARFSIRSMASLAAVVNVVATLTLVAVPCMPTFIVIMCIKTTFHGLTLVPSVSLIGYYFKKKRAFAMSFCILGLSFGASTVPLLINYLRYEYGFTGCILLYGAVELHAIPISMLLRPLNLYHTSTTKKGQQPKENVLTPSIINTNTSRADDSHPLMTAPSESEDALPEGKDANPGSYKTLELRETTDFNSLVETSCQFAAAGKPSQTQYEEEGLVCEQQLSISNSFCTSSIPNNKDERESESEEVAAITSVPPRKPGNTRVRSTDTLKDENRRIASARHNQMTTSDLETPTVTLSQSCIEHKQNQNALRTFLTSLVDIELLKKPLAISALLSYNLFNEPMFLNVYLPSYGEEMGASPSQAALLLTVSGIVDICSKLLLGFVTDLKVMAPYKTIIIGCVCIGVVCQLAGFFHGLGPLIFFASCLGFFGGSGVSLNSVHMIQLLGVNALSKMLALCILTFSVTAVFQNMLIGVLIERTGSFKVPMHYCGINYLLASLVLSFVPLTRKLQASLEQKEKV